VINLNVTTATRAGLNLLALIGVVVALSWGESICIPTVIAALLAAILWPAATWLKESCRFPWGLACMTVVVGMVALNLVVTLGFTLAVTKIVQDLPDPRDPAGQEKLYQDIRKPLIQIMPAPFAEEYFPETGPARGPHAAKPDEAAEKVARVEPGTAKDDGTGKRKQEGAESAKEEPPKTPFREAGVFRLVKEALNPEKPYLVPALLSITRYGSNWLWQWVLIMFILLFLMLEGPMLSRRLVEIFGPSAEAQAKAVATLEDMARQIRTYLVWRTIINFGLGLIVGLVYHVLMLRHPWVWALLTAILCYIPYLGPIVAGVPPVLDAFINCPLPGAWLGILIFYVALITLEGYVVVPLVMGRSMEMNATTVMLACLFWELVWGLPGLFLAMPLMAGIKAICAHVPGWEAWANLMSTREAEPELAKVERLPGQVFGENAVRAADGKAELASRPSVLKGE
jgi:predicted PurR-regulated permease PerM